jgi:transcription initiation factor IIE alpha subunit
MVKELDVEVLIKYLPEYVIDKIVEDIKNKKKQKNNENAKKNYYEKYKNNVLQKFTCDICQGSYRKTDKSKHFNTKKHMKAQAKLDEVNKENENNI